MIANVTVNDNWTAGRDFIHGAILLLRRETSQYIYAARDVANEIVNLACKAIATIERCYHLFANFRLKESIRRVKRNLVDDRKVELIVRLIRSVDTRFGLLKTRIEYFVEQVNILLQGTDNNDSPIDEQRINKLEDEVNQISEMVNSCETNMTHARTMLADLDKSMAVRGFIARTVSVVGLVGTLGAIGVGGVIAAPLIAVAAPAAILSAVAAPAAVGVVSAVAAGTTHKAAELFRKQRDRLYEVEEEHTLLLEELTDEHHKFKAKKMTFQRIRPIHQQHQEAITAIQSNTEMIYVRNRNPMGT